MNLFVKDLPPETQILIATGSAIAAGCQPCLERLVALANDERISDAQMRAAATIGQFVKDQPRQHMKEFADGLLGSSLADPATGIPCACEEPAAAQGSCCG